jgi:hypothetical protein
MTLETGVRKNLHRLLASPRAIHALPLMAAFATGLLANVAAEPNGFFTRPDLDGASKASRQGSLGDKVDEMRGPSKDTTLSKIDSYLKRKLSAMDDRDNAMNARRRGVASLSNRFVHVNQDGGVQIYVLLSSVKDENLDSLRASGLEIEVTNKRFSIVQGWAPFDRIIQEIAQLPFVKFVKAPTYGEPRAGTVTTEGIAILRSNHLRNLGFDGAGVKVGIISDGANDRAAAQASNDLPANITVFGNCSPRPVNGPSCDRGITCNEGTAMLEIVHDIAPGAQLAMGATSTTLEFVQRVDQLVNTFGADIIVDDIGFFLEPYFADGLVAQAVGDVIDEVVFVSAAGNASDAHHEANYVATFAQGLEVHDFGSAAGRPTDASMNVVIESGDFMLSVLQWSGPGCLDSFS